MVNKVLFEHRVKAGEVACVIQPHAHLDHVFQGAVGQCQYLDQVLEHFFCLRHDAAGDHFAVFGGYLAGDKYKVTGAHCLGKGTFGAAGCIVGGGKTGDACCLVGLGHDGSAWRRLADDNNALHNGMHPGGMG